MSSQLRSRIDSRRRIYLLRHGEVSYFDGGGRPFRADAVPLNATGMAQAAAAREALGAIPIDRAIHTGLLRTRQTLEIILEGRSVPPEACEALREVAPGRLASDPSAAGFEQSVLGALGGHITRETRFLGGETFGSLQDRVLPAFKELVSSAGWKHLLIVAHGGTNRVILLHALGASLDRLGCLEQEAGCVNLIDVDGGCLLLVRQTNFTPYSPLKENIWPTTMEKIYLEHYDGAASIPRPAEHR